MFFLSIPHAWHLVGTWSEQLPNNNNLLGMSQQTLMMTLHSIFIPIFTVVGLYLLNKIYLKEMKKQRIK